MRIFFLFFGNTRCVCTVALCTLHRFSWVSRVSFYFSKRDMVRRLAHCSVHLALLLAVASARSAETNPTTNSIDGEAGRSATGNGNVFGDLRQMYQIYKECADEDLSSCLKVRLLSVIDRVSRSVQLNVADGVTFVQDDPISEANVASDEPPKSLQEIEASLPRSLEDKEDALNAMIFDKVVKFFQSHTLKLKLPNVEELQRSLVEEGERKSSKRKSKLETLRSNPLIPKAMIRKKESPQFRFPGSVDRMAHSFPPLHGNDLQFSTSLRTLLEFYPIFL